MAADGCSFVEVFFCRSIEILQLARSVGVKALLQG
jgi:hypothetical protein